MVCEPECSVTSAFETLNAVLPDVKIALNASKLSQKGFGEKLSGVLIDNLLVGPFDKKSFKKREKVSF